MAPTPTKKSKGRHLNFAAQRHGPRDSRQMVHRAGSSPSLPPVSKGYRRGSHGRGPSTKKRPVVQQLGSGDDESGEDPEVVVVESRPSAGSNLRGIVDFRGEELPEEAQVQLAMLKSAMSARLSKNASLANSLSFTPDFLETMVNNLNGIRKELMDMARKAAPTTERFVKDLAANLPVGQGTRGKLSRRQAKKSNVASILTETFFTVQDVLKRTTEGGLPTPRSRLGKYLEEFVTVIVRIRNTCQHELADAIETKRALKSLPMSDEEMQKLWTDKDVKDLGMFADCANCGHPKTRYVDKRGTDRRNRATGKVYEEKDAEHREKLKAGEKSTPPTSNQESYRMGCFCFQVVKTHYGATIDCELCDDGTCKLCICPCSFVCKLTDYQKVVSARIAKETNTPLPADHDNAKAFLNGATSLKSDTIGWASDAYSDLESEGKLGSHPRDSAGKDRAISHQASLATSTHISYNPPGFGARKQLKEKMGALEHPKGASWISKDGVDVSLAVKASKRREANNNLRGVQKLNRLLEADGENDGDVLDVWDGDRKPAAKADKAGPPAPAHNIDLSRAKVERMKGRAKKGINYDMDVDEMDPKDRTEQEKEQKALKAYSASMRNGTCGDVMEMVGDSGDEDWEVGESQGFHQRFKNTQGWKHMD